MPRRISKPFPWKAPLGAKPLGIVTGNQAIAMGGAAAGVKFYAAYPMSPSTGVLMWMAQHARQLGIMVRQVEDEIGVMNMVIGAAHTGCRAMCATSGGGFALMTEAIGMAGMIETPVVCVDVQRAGPATGVPTKTEQGDLWQVLGAGQGDYPRLIVAPTSQLDLFQTIPELFNLCDKYQCPGLVLADLLISEGTSSIDPDDLDFNVKIDRGELILPNGNGNGATSARSGYNDKAYLRFKNTESGISPRAVPGVPGHIFTAATDEHDEDGTLVSDEFTNPNIRRMMVEKRGRKMKACDQRHRAAQTLRSRKRRRHAGRLGFNRGRDSRSRRETRGRRRDRGQSSSDQMDRSIPRRRDQPHPLRRASRSSSSRTITAASSPAISAARPASTPTATSANTTASRSCRITSSKRSKNNWPAKPNSPSPSTKCWHELT